MKTPFPKYDEALVLAIEEHLELDHLTEIVSRPDMMIFTSTGKLVERFRGMSASGGGIADLDGTVIPRLMIQSLSTDPGRFGPKRWVEPCEACDNFAVSWKCADHPEKSWDTEIGRWVRTDGRPYFTPVEEPTFPDADGSILSLFTDRLPSDASLTERFDAVNSYLAELGDRYRPGGRPT